MTTDDLPPLRDVIATAGLSADKKFGQNFLLDLNITRKIVRVASLPTHARVVEIGPGPGGLTRALLEAGHHVHSIELDPRVRPVLLDIQRVYPAHFSFEIGDALSFNWPNTLQEMHGAHIVANLPYNVATPLIIGWLRVMHAAPHLVPSMSVMVQKEVGERICAGVSSKAYGRLAVMTQWIAAPQIVMRLPPNAFTPAPKVESVVVRFVPHADRGDTIPFEVMEKIVASAFNQRRKMIRSSLSSYGFDFNALGIPDTHRAENLSVADFVSLANTALTQGVMPTQFF